jgi:hypothetical protein
MANLATIASARICLLRLISAKNHSPLRSTFPAEPASTSPGPMITRATTTSHTCVKNVPAPPATKNAIRNISIPPRLPQSFLRLLSPCSNRKFARNPPTRLATTLCTLILATAITPEFSATITSAPSAPAPNVPRPFAMTLANPPSLPANWSSFS